MTEVQKQQLDDLLRTAEAFRVAMIQSGAVNKVSQDTYFTQLRDLEKSLNRLNYLPVNADVSLARQLQRSMERNARMVKRMQQVGRIFSGLNDTLAAALDRIIKDEEPIWPPSGA